MHLIALFLHPFGLYLNLLVAYARVIVLNAEIFSLLNRYFPVTRVFIIFEIEEEKCEKCMFNTFSSEDCAAN